MGTWPYTPGTTPARIRAVDTDQIVVPYDHNIVHGTARIPDGSDVDNHRGGRHSDRHVAGVTPGVGVPVRFGAVAFTTPSASSTA